MHHSFAWESFFAWWKGRPEAIRTWPARRKAKAASKKEARSAKAAAKAKAKAAKEDGAAKKASGEPLFTPLPVSDDVMLFGKEGK